MPAFRCSRADYRGTHGASRRPVLRQICVKLLQI
jgi:hypothetical protein